MGSLGSESDETTSNGNSDADDGDTQSFEFDSQFSPFSGEDIDINFNELEYLENAQPRDTVFSLGAFETQLMDFDSEPQLLNFADETQVLDLAEETQVLDNDDETQLCEFDEEEAVRIGSSHEEVAVGTKMSIDVESADTRMMHPASISSKDEGVSEQVSSFHSADVDVTSSSGSVMQGFTSIRTASLRKSGLSARKKMAVKDESNPSEVCDGALNQESDVRKTNEGIKWLNQEHKDNIGDGTKGEDFCQEHICSDGLAGLSYVNSQEPQDSSQANALEFVDRFLKASVCALDLETKQLDGAYKSPNPVPSAKGAQKLAKKLDISNSLAENGVYEWDDRHEDEGGGDFITRNKEVLFSSISGGRKSLSEPPKPKHNHQMMKRTRQKAINKEHQSINAHDKVTGLGHSEPRFAAGRKLDQLEQMSIRRNLDRGFKKQVGKGSTVVQLRTEDNDAEMRETFDIGVDTQMAVEAIEALSNGVLLSTDEGENAFQGDGCKGELNNRVKQNRAKENPIQKRVNRSDLGVTTRSKQTKRTTDESKFPSTSQARSKNVGKKAVKGKRSRAMQNTAKIRNRNLKGIQDKRTFNVQDKANERTPERNLDDNGSIPAKKRRIEEQINTVAPIASRTRKTMLATANNASVLSDDPKTMEKVLRVVDADGSGRKINNCLSDTKEKAIKLNTLRDGVYSDELGNGQNTSVQLSGNGTCMISLEESARLAAGQSITRHRRSSRRVQSSKQNQLIVSTNEKVCCSPSAEKAQIECPTTQGTPKDTEKTSLSTCTTPVNCRTSINAASPVCMGDEYYKLSCKKNLERSCLMKELNSLTPSRPRCSLSDKSMRKRRDIASIRILFSHHLGDDVIRHQKKILARLGVAAVSSILDATHFVSDEFVRTRNMLEAIAHGKPIVNHLWLESCGQAGCYIDERNYILRDVKKEKELGFNMPVSLARASQHPLLEGRRVLITPNIKPGVEILLSLVKAVHGQAFERICRSMYKDDSLSDDLLVLSCEEDFEICLPLLEKGAEVYSSELLLNGIVVQRLDFERHRLFTDHVKRTRSTIWLRKDGSEFHPVSRHV